jgi:two-component system OmpR family sensor kinase
MRRLAWATVALPIGISLIILLLMVNGTVDDPVFDIRVDEGLLVVLVGGALSGMITINLLSQRWQRQLHRQSMERARVETAEEHRRFLNRLDHELKNPLTAIRAGLVNLNGTSDETARRTIVTSIETQVERLSHLVSDLRKVADIGARPLEYGTLDLNELLREVMAMALENPVAAQRQLSLTLPENPLTLPHIRGDGDLLVLALHNLVGNAIKFTQPGGRIDVRGYAAGQAVVIEIEDTGIGIPSEELSLVWEELYRGLAARSIPGSGVGLALAQTVIERHHGHISLRSVPGQGTTVTIQLPAGEP